MAINKGESAGKRAEGNRKDNSEDAGYEGIIDRLDRMNKLVKNPEFLKTINDLVAQPADKRQEFIEKAFDRDELNKRGVMLKGNKIKFKPANSEKKAATKRQLGLSIRIPDVGTVIVRGKY